MPQPVEIKSGGTISILLFLILLALWSSCNKLADISESLKQIELKQNK